MTITTINPASGEVLKEYQTQTVAELDAVIQSSHQAFSSWSKLSFDDRAKLFMKLSELLKANKEDYAMLMTTEMGKTFKSAVAEVEKCALMCEHSATFAEEFLKPDYFATENSKSYVVYQPTGPIFAIMPWNFPLWQVLRFACPNLMAGNVGILKHAPCVTGCGLLVERIFKEAGFPEGVFQTVVLDNDTAKHAIEHPLVAGVTLTGSVRAGKAVGAMAAGAIKKCVLELGGSDPYVILKDADLVAAADIIVNARLAASGQVCISPKRLIIEKPVFEEFKHLVMEKIKDIQYSDPMEESSRFGPLAREDLRAELHDQVQRCVAQGATLLCGGEMPDTSGFYYPVTALTDIKPGMPAYDEELFGPVFCFFEAEDEADALRIANDTVFGLGAAVFTKDLKKGEEIANSGLIAGTVCVNRAVSSNPRLPFGGAKSSGIGREMSELGVKEFMNAKTIMIA